ncbi:MAG: FHA domain-containing protein [Microbacterium sp.]|uniref:FHA domain-containing protein n=1 Tax=Microbacterium sp. TaxID=51671 RepID=UPI003F9DCB1D
MQTTYRAGNWYVLVSPGALIALSPEAPEELVMRLWERERTAGDLAAVIDALTDQAAGSFAAMLPFAAVVLEGADARFAVRGDATVRVTGPDGVESFTGANVTTWSERFVANASRIAVVIDDADGGALLPITGGIVRAASASAEIEPSDVTAADAAHIDIASADESAITAAPVVESAITAAPVVESASVENAEPVNSAPVVPEPVVPAPVMPAPVVPEPVFEAPAPEEPSTEAPQNPATEPITEAPEVVDDAVNEATLLPVETTYASDADEFDQMFGATVVSPGAIAPPPPAVPVPAGGDHDGATISAAEARALRKNAPAASPEAPTEVLPVVAGAAGRISVSTGQVVTLDRTVIIGRKPRSTRASGAELPHLIAVESPQQDISRSHLEIRPEGDTVVVVDLHTTNGSTLLRPGADPLRLHPGEQTLVLSGDVVDLGDGVLVTFEDLP